MAFAVTVNKGEGQTLKHVAIYRVIQEESAILWEMIVCVILSKKNKQVQSTTVLLKM